MPDIVGFFGENAFRYENLAKAQGYHPIVSNSRLSIWQSDISSAGLSQVKLHDLSIWIGGHIVSPDDCRHDLHSWLTKRFMTQGIQAFAELQGSFFIIALDHKDRSLTICRGTGGAELIYHHQDNEHTLWFANKLETLIKLIDGPSLSKSSLFEYLRFLDISPPNTIYSNIFMLEPNKMIHANSKDHRLIEKNPRPFARLEGYPADLFEGLLIESIQKQIEGMDRLGAFLSGGIDSSLMCALISKLRKDCKLLTVGFDDPQFDESKIAKKIAHHLGLEQEIFIFTPQENMEAFHEFTASTASPFADPAIIPTLLCFKRLKNRFDCILDGTGADSLIGSMPCRHIRFILDYSRHLPHWARIQMGRMMRAMPGAQKYAELFDFTDERELLIRWKGFNRSEIAELCQGFCDFSNTLFYKTFDQYSDKSAYEIYSRLFQAMNDDRIHQTAARLDLHIEFPYMDAAARNYVNALPERWKHSSNETKRLYRRILKKYVPEELWDLPKHGFDYPFHRLLQHNDFELIERYLNPEALKIHHFFDAQTVANHVARFKRGDQEVKFKLWALVVFQAWYAHYFLSL